MKRLVSLLLAVVMVISMFAVVPVSASAASTKTVYFQNTWMWTDVKAYFWGSSSGNSAEWPGDAMQVAGNDGTYDVYSITVPADVAGIVFNGYDSGKGGNNQTPSIKDSADGDCYYMIWENENKVGKAPISEILPDIQPTTPPTISSVRFKTSCIVVAMVMLIVRTVFPAIFSITCFCQSCPLVSSISIWTTMPISARFEINSAG